MTTHLVLHERLSMTIAYNCWQGRITTKSLFWVWQVNFRGHNMWMTLNLFPFKIIYITPLDPGNDHPRLCISSNTSIERKSKAKLMMVLCLYDHCFAALLLLLLLLLPGQELAGAWVIRLTYIICTVEQACIYPKQWFTLKIITSLLIC